MRRIEETLVGRLVLTAVMALLVASLVVWNLPDGPAVRPLKPAASHVLLPLGLDQDWSVFAPEPRSFSVGVYADVTLADGRQVRWRPPDGGLLVAPYATYRWQKYVERLRADDFAWLWDDAARAIARQVTSVEGTPVRRVVLVRTYRDSVVPGTHGPAPRLQQYSFYAVDLP